MRPIDADAIADFIEAMYKSAEGHARSAYRICLEEVLEAPTIDAVPVVRCKDCDRKRVKKYDDHNELYCLVYDVIVPEKHFCGYAERSEDGET